MSSLSPTRSSRRTFRRSCVVFRGLLRSPSGQSAQAGTPNPSFRWIQGGQQFAWRSPQHEMLKTKFAGLAAHAHGRPVEAISRFLEAEGSRRVVPAAESAFCTRCWGGKDKEDGSEAVRRPSPSALMQRWASSLESFSCAGPLAASLG